MANAGQHDGLMARFLVATPPEVFVTLHDKVEASSLRDQLDMTSLLRKVSLMYSGGTTFSMANTAMDLFANYHDNDVLSVSFNIFLFTLEESEIDFRLFRNASFPFGPPQNCHFDNFSKSIHTILLLFAIEETFWS